jgi:hypothetical protein
LNTAEVATVNQGEDNKTPQQVYEGLKGSIARQREVLSDMLKIPLQEIADMCAAVWPDRELLNQALMSGLDSLPYCQFLYALDTDAQQISDNASHQGLLTEHFGRDRSTRPYVNKIVPAENYILSGAYMSLRAYRPSVTAIQVVRKEGNVVGFVGADFDLRDLPLTRVLYEETPQWKQIKGDPAIRGNVFLQTRVQSRLDEQLDDALIILEELMTVHGVFHTQIHFSSSRAIIWLRNDPFRYRLLDVNELMDPEICFAYPIVEYPDNAVIKVSQIKPILDSFRQLRFGDESIYLRSGSMNIFNGLIGLNFSCDGSHYIPHAEFLGKDMSFWGISAASQSNK